MKTVIFACVHNAGRSQMAAAFFNRYADPAKALAISGGTEPAPRVHPEVLLAMKELSIDLSQAKPILLTPQLAESADLLVTMGCGEKCPYIPGLEIKDWNLEDPKGKDQKQVHLIRDQIQNLVKDLVNSHHWA